MSTVPTGLRMICWLRQPHPTLKRGANNHCAYGAGLFCYDDADSGSPSNGGLRHSSRAFVHGFVGELVGVLVSAAEGVANFEAGDAAGELSCFFKERAEDGAGYLVLALHLLDHQLGVGDDAEALDVVFDGPLEHAKKAGVLGVVVGADAEELAQFGYDAAFGVLDDGAVAGGAGIASGAAVAVGGEEFAGGFGGGIGKEVLIHCLLVYRVGRGVFNKGSKLAPATRG